MPLSQQTIVQIAATATDRIGLWAALASASGANKVAEIGVYRGDFAAAMLDRCPQIDKYTMVDPWRSLPQWNKPANESDVKFEAYFDETMQKTAAYKDRRVVLRGRTQDVVGRIPQASLDLAYIDGDHTLRGITIDLQLILDRVRDGGWIGGDDFSPSIWQHPEQFEPTLVFPYAVYFAEAIGAPIYALPFNQFVIHARSESSFEFVDLTGNYPDLSLLSQVDSPRS